MSFRGKNGYSAAREALLGKDDGVKSFEEKEFCGVALGEDFAVSEHCHAEIFNMLSDGATLKTRKAQSLVFSPAPFGGASSQILADCFYNGSYVFKKGNSLYVHNIAANTTRSIVSSLTGTDWHIAHIADGFVAYSESGAFYNISDDGMRVVGNEIHIPIIYNVTSGSTPNGTRREPINMLTEYFYLYLSGNSEFEIPKELYVDDFIEAYNSSSGERVYDDTSISPHIDGGATITTYNARFGLNVKLRFKRDATGAFSTYDDIQLTRKLLFSPLCRERMLSAVAGAEIIVACAENDNRIGIVRADGALYIKPDDIRFIKENENVTGIIRYDSNFLVFSEHYIKKMILGESESAFSAEFEMLSYDIGCDVPHSIVCTDDRIIYLHSTCGVFYINRFGISEKDMSRKVSINIEKGANGLFACGASELENAFATVCDSKYFLHIGERFYVWDFRYSVPRSSVEREAEEREMKWYIFSDMGCRRVFDNGLHGFYFEGDGGSIMYYENGASGADAVSARFRSREHTFSYFGKTLPLRLMLLVNVKTSCKIRFYFDGEVSAGEYEIFETGGFTVYAVRPEKRECGRFSFEISGEDGFALAGYKIEYM